MHLYNSYIELTDMINENSDVLCIVVTEIESMQRFKREPSFGTPAYTEVKTKSGNSFHVKETPAGIGKKINDELAFRLG